MLKWTTFIVSISSICLLNLNSFSQAVQPDLWLKPDSLVNSQLFYTQHGKKTWLVEYDTLLNHSFSYLNGHKLFNLNGGTSISVLGNSLKGRHISVLIVYQPDSSQSNQGLYEFRSDSLLLLGVTNKHISQMATQLKYSDTLITAGVVSSIKAFTLHPIPGGHNKVLHIGRADSLDFKGKIGEIIVFNRKTRPEILPYYETYLALKYGITLFDANYTTLSDTIWSKTSNANYHYDVAGLGTDSLTGLKQIESESSANDLVKIGLEFSLQNSSSAQLNQGSFLIWGRNSFNCDDVAHEAVNIDSSIAKLNREWKIQSYGTFDSIYAKCFLRFDNSRFSFPSTPLLKVRKNENHAGEIIQPDSIDASGYVYYRNLSWDSDSSGSDFFSFVFPYLTPLQMPQGLTVTGNNFGVENGGNALLENNFQGTERSNQYPLAVGQRITHNEQVSLVVFPVPSNASVNSRIFGLNGESARLEIFNSIGAKIESFELEGSNQFLLSHQLNPGEYMFVLSAGMIQITRKVFVIK